MKIVIIGASGTVGRAVTEALSRKHEVVRVGRTQGDYQVDITSQESVEALFEKVGRVDAIVSATGNLFFGPLSTMTDQDFNQGLQDKLLGQIRLALTGQHFLNDGGSITLISGIIAQEPIAQGANAATINAGLEGFVRAVSSRALKVSPPPPSPTPIAAVWKASRPGVFIKSVTDKSITLPLTSSVRGKPLPIFRHPFRFLFAH